MLGSMVAPPPPPPPRNPSGIQAQFRSSHRLASRRVICGEIGSSPRLLAGWSGVSACGGVSRRRGNQTCHIRGQRRHPQVNDPVGPHLSGARTSVTWMRSLLRACVRREVCGTARWTRRGLTATTTRERARWAAVKKKGSMRPRVGPTRQRESGAGV